MLSEPAVPSLKGLGYEEFAGKFTVDRTLLGPPDIPKDRAEILKKAVWEALNDPEFIKLCEKMKIPIDPEDSENTKNTTLGKISFFLKHGSAIKEVMEKAGFAN